MKSVSRVALLALLAVGVLAACSSSDDADSGAVGDGITTTTLFTYDEAEADEFYAGLDAEQRAEVPVVKLYEIAQEEADFLGKRLLEFMKTEIMADDPSAYPDCFWRRAADLTSNHLENEALTFGQVGDTAANDLRLLADTLRLEANIDKGFAVRCLKGRHQ